MESVPALTAEHFDQRLTRLESLLIERFERRLAETRFDILKWSFVFWIGQVAAVVGLISLLLRSFGRQ